MEGPLGDFPGEASGWHRGWVAPLDFECGSLCEAFATTSPRLERAEPSGPALLGPLDGLPVLPEPQGGQAGM